MLPCELRYRLSNISQKDLSLLKRRNDSIWKSNKFGKLKNGKEKTTDVFKVLVKVFLFLWNNYCFEIWNVNCQTSSSFQDLKQILGDGLELKCRHTKSELRFKKSSTGKELKMNGDYEEFLGCYLILL